ncbi:unnamed protein product [Heligmosomoides polygyrus]|uniref:HA2 domain-containing protein n=1 Tax=Heligmosomoides polygyrus TaxID=6339 RepID=A0A183FMJ7_HELPZ|nr:unnamed protein product [Heligmosomoides polygyrus]
MTLADLMKCIAECNSVPVIAQMLVVACEINPMDYSDAAEADRRSRSIVISGLKESRNGGSTYERHRGLVENVCDVRDVLRVECGPSDVYLMGKPDPSRPRLVKALLPSRSHWNRVLANPRFFRKASVFEDVFVRRSTTPEERKQDFELRKLAKERNAGKSRREWVVNRGLLKHVSELPNRESGNM